MTRERVRQIEQRALRKMQHPNVKQKLLTTGFYEIFGKVNIKPEQLKTHNEVH